MNDAGSYDLLFLLIIVEKNKEYFIEDGAVKLNHLLQERARFSSEQAFRFIWDAIETGGLIIDKRDNKRLYHSDSMLNDLRNRYADYVPEIQSQVVGNRWKFKGSVRSSFSGGKEQALYYKYIKCGIIKEIPMDVTGAAVEDVNDKTKTIINECIEKLVDAVGSRDFVLTIERSGTKVTPKISVSDRKDKVIIDWNS